MFQAWTQTQDIADSGCLNSQLSSSIASTVTLPEEEGLGKHLSDLEGILLFGWWTENGKRQISCCSKSDKLRITEKSLERHRMFSYSLWIPHGMNDGGPARSWQQETEKRAGYASFSSALQKTCICRKTKKGQCGELANWKRKKSQLLSVLPSLPGAWSLSNRHMWTMSFIGQSITNKLITWLWTQRCGIFKVNLKTKNK